MLSRFYLFLSFVIGCQFSRAQIIEEMTVLQFGYYIDSLIENDKKLEAYDMFYSYTNFLPAYNKRMSNQKELMEIQSRILEAVKFLKDSPKEDLFNYNKPIIYSALKDGNFHKALLYTAQFKDGVLEATSLYDSITQLLPIDSIEVYGVGFPPQLFSAPQTTNAFSPHSLIDSTLFYLKRDSSLFSGVVISRENDPMSMLNELAVLNYDRFINGKRVERQFQSFVFSNSFHKNQLFFGHDSCHYQLYHKSVYNESDTIRTYFFGNNEELLKEQESLKQKNGVIELIKEIEYNSNGTIIKWKELAPISDKHSMYNSYWCWVNQFGDTLNDGFTFLKNDIEINQERTLNEQGDTIYLSRTVNSVLDGLQIEISKSSEGLNFELRYVFDNGKLIKILSDSVVYFDENWNVISKEEYIHLMNDESNDDRYFYSGFFMEYFPDVDFKAFPYYLAPTCFGKNDFKLFKKSVKNYFNVKI